MKATLWKQNEYTQESDLFQSSAKAHLDVFQERQKNRPRENVVYMKITK